MVVTYFFNIFSGWKAKHKNKNLIELRQNMKEKVTRKAIIEKTIGIIIK